MGVSCCRQSPPSSPSEGVTDAEVHGLQYLCGLHGKVGPPCQEKTTGKQHKDVTLPCLLVSGKQFTGSQEAFAQKPSDLRGPTPFKALTRPVGVVCQKGFKAPTLTPTGKKGKLQNQDNFLAIQSGKLGIYGVFDGHGPDGHALSSFVSSSLPTCLARDPDFQDDTLNAIWRAYSKTQGNIQRCAKKGLFNCKRSGSTATLLVVREDEWCSTLYVAHIGDSRAVLARSEADGSSVRVQDLTLDHKPGTPSEKQRILAAGGVVLQLDGDTNERVFMKNKMAPGLAMSRSFGDFLGASVGVSSEPDLQELKVEKDWLFVLICSDGIWEFVTSHEAVEIVRQYHPNQVQQGAEALAEEARRRWLEEDSGSYCYVDDITVLCIGLNCRAANSKAQDGC